MQDSVQDEWTDEVKDLIVTDRSGNDFRMIEVRGVPHFPVEYQMINDTPENHFRNLRNLETRSDDVMICAYPKAGTHWIWEVIQMLRSQSTEYQKQIKENQMLEFGVAKNINEEPSPRLLNSHLWPRHLPTQMFEKKMKIIYLLRNPKDTAISYYFHVNGIEEVAQYYGNVHDFVDLFLHKTLPYGSWYDYVQEWERFIESNENPVHQLTYEDMTRNPLEHVKGLAKFLEIEISDKLAGDIVEACSFKKLKKANEEIKDDFLKKEWKDGHSPYRKGKIGDWKNWLTVAEDEIFDKVTAERMKDSNIRLTYE